MAVFIFVTGVTKFIDFVYNRVPWATSGILGKCHPSRARAGLRLAFFLLFNRDNLILTDTLTPCFLDYHGFVDHYF